MEYLLDTNVLSETRRRKADRHVLEFLAGCDPSAIYISVLTLGELRKGVAQKKHMDPASAKLLGAWVDGLEFSFSEHILGVNAAAARLWGEWSADRPRPVVDTLLAATAAERGLTLVTRNTRDMKGLKVDVLNPWKE
jgi:hypothetical protein